MWTPRIAPGYRDVRHKRRPHGSGELLGPPSSSTMPDVEPQSSLSRSSVDSLTGPYPSTLWISIISLANSSPCSQRTGPRRRAGAHSRDSVPKHSIRVDQVSQRSSRAVVLEDGDAALGVATARRRADGGPRGAGHRKEYEVIQRIGGDRMGAAVRADRRASCAVRLVGRDVRIGAHAASVDDVQL